MVVRNNRYHQHDHADEYKKSVMYRFLCILIFLLRTKIEVNGLITKC